MDWSCLVAKQLQIPTLIKSAAGYSPPELGLEFVGEGIIALALEHQARFLVGATCRNSCRITCGVHLQCFQHSLFQEGCGPGRQLEMSVCRS